MTTPAPVTLLRATNLPPLLDANGSATDDLRVASVAVFGEHLIRVDDASGYKRYPLLSLLFFLREALQGTDHASYMQRALAHWQGSAREAPPIVSVIDRRETLAYLTGESASLPGAGEAAGPGKRDHEAVVEDGEGEEERRVRVRMLEDFERLKENVLSKERCIVDLSNFLSRGVTKSFTNAIKYSSEILRPGAPTKVGTAVAAVPGSKANDPKARGSSSASKPPASLSAKPSTSSKKPSSSSKPAPSSSSKPNSKASTSAKIPIIIVPPSVTSSITLFNAKSFLGDSKYITTQEGQTQNPDKPALIALERRNTPSGLPKLYHILDSVDRVKPEDWDRIVAVFATGQEWQFKGWRWGAPVNIFSRCKGFCLKFAEEPVHEKILSWNVSVLSIHRTKRHLDAQTVNDFWMAVDAFIRENRASQFSR